VPSCGEAQREGQGQVFKLLLGGVWWKARQPNLASTTQVTPTTNTHLTVYAIYLCNVRRIVISQMYNLCWGAWKAGYTNLVCRRDKIPTQTHTPHFIVIVRSFRPMYGVNVLCLRIVFCELLLLGGVWWKAGEPLLVHPIVPNTQTHTLSVVD
jgi:hypothetical protein